MNYYEQDDRKGRIGGIIGLVLYVALCVGLMFVSYTITLPEPSLGILVDFGTSDTGSGDDDLAHSEVDARPVSPRQQNRPVEPVMTTDDPTAPAIVEQPRPQTQPARPVEETVPQREVNQRALFPGRTEGSTATSQGTAGGVGNQGSEDGAPGGSDSEGGSGWSGTSSLIGRRETGNWPMPRYKTDDGGRIVINIVVDATGKVVSATYEPKGSTIPYGELAEETEKAARRATFTPKPDQDAQSGSITYNYKLN